VVATITDIVDDENIEISYDPWSAAAPVADHAGSGFAVIADATKAVYPEAVVVPSLLFGATDTRHYIDLVDNLYRYHGMLIDTSQAKGVHGTDEFIEVESFVASIKIARQMIQLGTQ
jgi:carboxypeptidase PM20D1